MITRHARLLAIALGIAAAGGLLRVVAQAPRSPAADQMLAYPVAENLIASPSTALVAWTVDERGLRNIYVAEGPEFRPRRLTSYPEDDGRALADLSFSDDGTYLVYVRGSNPAVNRPQVWSIEVADGEPHQLGDGEKPVIAPRTHRVAFLKEGRIWIAPIDGSSPAESPYVRGVSESLTWSPDGETLAFASNRETHGFITLFTRMNRPVRYLAPSTARDSAPVWSSDGAEVAFIRQSGRGPAALFEYPRTDPWAIWIGDVPSGAAHEVWRSGSLPQDSLPDLEGGAQLRWAGATRLAFVSYQDGWPHVYSVSKLGGPVLPLTPGPFTVDRFSISPDGRSIVYSANAGSERDDVDRRHLFRIRADSIGPPEQLTTGRAIEWNPLFLNDGSRLAYIASTGVSGPLPAIRRFDGTPARVLGSDRVPPDFPGSMLAEPEAVTLRGGDGAEVHAQLFKSNAGEAKGPALVFLHDGPEEQSLLGWPLSSHASFAYVLNQYLATRGFVVLSLNYRSGAGYGFAYQHVSVAGGPPGYDDILAAASYMRTRPDVDPQRVGIWGESFGGYLVAVALARNSDVFTAGVVVDGPPDLIGREIENLTVSVDDDCAITTSPLHWTAPTLILHGTDDGSARYRVDEQLDRRLRQQEANVEIEEIPDEAPRYRTFAARRRIALAIAAYFDRVLRRPAAR
jgi:dipeptidyl aminopeptidase/acylaminoacyl peptidase